MSRQIPAEGQIYRHFKGNDYRIVCIAKSADTLEAMVVYQALYGQQDIYVRGLEEFMSPVDRTKYPGAEQEERFRLLEEQCEAEEQVEEEQIAEEQVEEELPLNPLVIQFLDASSAAEKLLILENLEKVAKEYDVSILLSAMEMQVDEKLSVPKRLEQIKQSLMLHQRYETDRLR